MLVLLYSKCSLRVRMAEKLSLEERTNCFHGQKLSILVELPTLFRKQTDPTSKVTLLPKAS